MNQTGSSDNKYQYAGEQFDSTIGDYYLRQRFYDTDAGRFIRRDDSQGRLSDPITLQKYIYANDNPVLLTDPTGYFSMYEGAAISVLAGILADLALPAPVNSSTRPGDVGYDPALERIILSAVLGIGIAKVASGIPGLFKALVGRGSTTRFIYPNLLPETLSEEVAIATNLGVKPFAVKSSEFAKVVREGETLKWVVSEKGELLLVPKIVNGREISHAVISDGKSVVAAGEAQIAGGPGQYFLLEITNHSGHFQPSSITTSIGRAALREAGVIVP